MAAPAVCAGPRTVVNRTPLRLTTAKVAPRGGKYLSSSSPASGPNRFLPAPPVQQAIIFETSSRLGIVTLRGNVFDLAIQFSQIDLAVSTKSTLKSGEPSDKLLISGTLLVDLNSGSRLCFNFKVARQPGRWVRQFSDAFHVVVPPNIRCLVISARSRAGSWGGTISTNSRRSAKANDDSPWLWLTRRSYSSSFLVKSLSGLSFTAHYGYEHIPRLGTVGCGRYRAGND